MRSHMRRFKMLTTSTRTCIFKSQHKWKAPTKVLLASVFISVVKILQFENEFPFVIVFE
jgi:hypothetical protein